MAESGGKENVNEPPVSSELQQEVTFQSVNDNVMANDEGSLPVQQHSDTTIHEKASQEARAFASTEEKNASNVDADCIIASVCKTVQDGTQTSHKQIGKDINMRVECLARSLLRLPLRGQTKRSNPVWLDTKRIAA